MVPKHGDLQQNYKRRVEATEMDDLRRSSRISRKERIRNVAIRQQIGLEEIIVKEIEQNQLTWLLPFSEHGYYHSEHAYYHSLNMLTTIL